MIWPATPLLKSLFGCWPGLALAVDEKEIRWRERPGFKAIDRLPVVAGQGQTAERTSAMPQSEAFARADSEHA